MFKFFLKKKILTRARKSTNEKPVAETSQPRKRNRRIIDRFNVDHKHLTILSDQNILVIKDISARGFATGLAKQSFDRFLIDDQYEGRMRYLGEAYDVRARVTWKHKDSMGFEIVRPTRQTTSFLSRLIEPVEIASSLHEVDSEFMQAEENKIWLHGDNDTDLYMWFSPAQELIAWQLCLGQDYVEWQVAEGVKTGKLNQSASNFAIPTGADENKIEILAEKKLERIRFAQDVIMASSVSQKQEIINSLLGVV